MYYQSNFTPFIFFLVLQVLAHILLCQFHIDKHIPQIPKECLKLEAIFSNYARKTSLTPFPSLN